MSSFEDIVKLYDEYVEQYGDLAYRYISEIFERVKEIHQSHFEGVDHGQSWRSFKGRNVEKLVEYILMSQVEEFGLKVMSGNFLERVDDNSSNLISSIKQQLLISYGEFGKHFPDADLVLYDPENYEVFAIVSIKATLHERIAQTGYWSQKLHGQTSSAHIRVFFVSLDEDGTLTSVYPLKKGRAIVEAETDKTYVMSKAEIEETDTVKMFDQFRSDVKTYLANK